MPESSFFSPIGKRVDDALTRYLRNTTSDQEILDFYGEGNIIGRKGIPANDNALLDQTNPPGGNPFTDLRPRVNRETGTFGEFGDNKSKTSVVDIPGTNSAESGRPWQMKFTELPFPREGGTTSAANRFLADFRVPIGTTVDYGFETSPNKEDVKSEMISRIVNNPGNYRNSSLAYAGQREGKPPSEWGDTWPGVQEDIDKYKNVKSGVIRFDGQITTPSRWAKEGFSVPEGLANKTLDTFKQQIMSAENPFGSVSQLTPVQEPESTLRPGGDPDWRAKLYERRGFAGPPTPITLKGTYDNITDDVQMFVRGKERLLPIQPYTEFLDPNGSFWQKHSAASALGTEPAPDFTRLQKAVGTRNYLLGRNILQGRGSLGAGLHAGLQVGAADFIPTPEAVRSFYAGKPLEGAVKMAGNFIGGIPQAVATGAAVTAAPALAPIAAGAGLGMTAVAAGKALNEVALQQTGEGLVPKFRQFIGTATRSGAANPPRTSPRPLTATVRPLTPAQKAEMERLKNQNEAQRRFALAKQRWNPARGEFGLSELLFGR